MKLAPNPGSTVVGALALVITPFPRRAGEIARLHPGYVAVALAVVAFLGTAWVATAVFDRLPHVEDDVIFLFQARTIASGHLQVPAPTLPEFFPIPFTIQRDGLWFGKYPPGYPAVLALGVIAGQPWLLNPVVGAACVGILYYLGRRLYGSGTALLAATLLTASPFFLLQSGSFMSHTASLLWTLLFTLLFVRAREKTGFVAVLAGAALGMLFLSRQLTAVGIGLPFVVWGVVDVLRKRGRWRAYGLILAGFLPFAAAVLVYNNLTTGSPFRSAYELYWPYDRIGFGPGIGSNG
ncbi:MAG: glycosyltransferase family 39 protein, partial [Chloroflexota bacterium]